MSLNHTHNPQAQCWILSANQAGCDFPIQNLPFGVFRRKGSTEVFRGGVAIGDQVVDLAALADAGLLQGLVLRACKACSGGTLNDFMAMGKPAWSALRHALFALLEATATDATRQAMRACLQPLNAIEHELPARIGDYTDFYTSIHHARNAGVLARPDNPLAANFQWLPVAYHGRSSSIGVSGQSVRRPMGQSMLPGATTPVYGPCARLDYELELGFYIGTGNTQGDSIPLDQAEDHIFGMCLLNDWSARDIQFWEMMPLGPFLGKNFATTVSPWIVSMEALASYREAWTRPADHPQPLAYLEHANNRTQGALDIQLRVGIESVARRTAGAGPATVSQTTFKHQYWTIAQMLTQHTVCGCNMQTGDLLGSGTISGPTPAEAGALLELTLGGKQPITLSGQGAPDEQRGFLADGDAVVFKAWCEKPGCARIGFGENRGFVLPAHRSS